MSNNYDFSSDIDIGDLINRTGRVVTVFTQSGGRSGRGFTGLLAEANSDFIKLISDFASAPRHPFGSEFGDFDDFGGSRGCRRRRECSRFSTVIIIPVNKIVAFVVYEF